VWRIGRKTLFFVPKFVKMRKMTQICWNLDWRSLINYRAQPKTLQPRFRVYPTFFEVLMSFWCMQFQWWKSLSCSYDVSVSISMVLQGVCHMYVWFFENEKWELGVFISNFQLCAKCVPKGKDCGRNRTTGTKDYNQVKFSLLKLLICQMWRQWGSHLIVWGLWISQMRWGNRNDREWCDLGIGKRGLRVNEGALGITARVWEFVFYELG